MYSAARRTLSEHPGGVSRRSMYSSSVRPIRATGFSLGPGPRDRGTPHLLVSGDRADPWAECERIRDFRPLCGCVVGLGTIGEPRRRPLKPPRSPLEGLGQAKCFPGRYLPTSRPPSPKSWPEAGASVRRMIGCPAHTKARSAENQGPRHPTLQTGRPWRAVMTLPDDARPPRPLHPTGGERSQRPAWMPCSRPVANHARALRSSPSPSESDSIAP